MQATCKPENASRDAVVAVLAGGLGSRIGGDKACAIFDGLPLISYPLTAAGDAGLRAIVLAKPSTRLPALGTEVVREGALPHHPLVGLIAALERFPRVLAVGCDMPYLTAALLQWMAALPDGPAAFAIAGRLAPFPSLHTAAELPVLRAALEREDSLRATLGQLGTNPLPVEQLLRFGAPERLLLSINAPDQLR